MTTQHVELPQALHVALLNCQAAHDARSRAHTAYLDSLVNHASKATQGRLHQSWTQAQQVADAAFRDLGRALDAEGGHDLWRIVYLKGGRTRSRIQVRPTRDSHRRREGQARLDLRRELEAQGAQVQYLVSLPVALIPDADRWDRTAGMVRLGHRVFQARNSLGGTWAVIAYGQAPAPAPHNPFTCLDVACAACHGLEPDPQPTPCLAKYADGWDFACTLPQGHDGQHQDDVTDAPATVAWYDTNAPWNIARQVPPEAAYARRLAVTGKCPTCQALHGNYHQDACDRQGVVGNLPGRPGPAAMMDTPRSATRTCSVCGCQEAPSTTCRHWNALADTPRQDAPCGPRKPQDARSAQDLTGWAPGEITEAYGR